MTKEAKQELRDEFAMIALDHVLQKRTTMVGHCVAADVYDIVDAMMKRRKETQ